MTLSRSIGNFFNKKILKKLLAYSLLIITLYLLQDFFGLFLLTFIFGYLAISLAEFFKEKSDFLISRFFSERKTRKILKTIFSIKLFVIIEYILFVALILFLIVKLIPNIVNELSALTLKIPELDSYKIQIEKKLLEFKQIGGSFSEIMKNKELFSQENLEILKSVLDQVKTASSIVLKIFLALILSFVFIIDRNKVKEYFSSIKKTSFAFFYDEYSLIATTVVDSFGRVFKAQAIIALVNTSLTVLGLILIGWIFTDGFPHSFSLFPFIYTLALIVFIAGFIPVAGVFISSIPIIIVAVTMVGGINAGLAVLALILLIHSLEAYYLNPRIVSSFMEMPMSMTFLILIISEHLMGVVGLIVGVSLFYFIKELFKDIDKITRKTSKKLAKKKKVEELCDRVALEKIKK